MIDVGEKKPRISLEEGQALLKVLLKDFKYDPISVEKAKVRKKKIKKDKNNPVNDKDRSIKDNG